MAPSAQNPISARAKSAEVAARAGGEPEALLSTLKDLNRRFHAGKLRDGDRSLFLAGMMLALADEDFARAYRAIKAPSEDDEHSALPECQNLNQAILDAITARLQSSTNGLSGEFHWRDKFSFIRNVTYTLADYQRLIADIEDRICQPYRYQEKRDILGMAYKLFLARAGKIDNRNIILTPGHIMGLMVKLAGLSADDVVLDTCTGSGGFLMGAMETMSRQAAGDDSVKATAIARGQLIGFELDASLFALAAANLSLHGDAHNLLHRSSVLLVLELT